MKIVVSVVTGLKLTVDSSQSWTQYVPTLLSKSQHYID